MINVFDSRNVAINVPLDNKLVNFYIDEQTSEFIIETVEQYLQRVIKEYRIPNIPITILIPIDDYNQYNCNLEDISILVSNFISIQYAFIGGIEDINFKELDSGDKTFHYEQLIPIRVWEIYHNMNKFPSVTITDFNGIEYEATFRYYSKNMLQIYFSNPFAGIAELN